MSRATSAFPTALLVGGLVGCASAGFVSTWKEPIDRPVALQGKRVAAIVIHPDPGLRREAESALARELSRRGAQGIAAYMLLGDEPPRDEAALRAILRDANIQGAVLMHPVGSDEEVSEDSAVETPWYSGPHYRSFYGYWGHGWAAAESPGHLPADTARVETLIYSIREDELLWAGRSKATDASRLDSFLRELASAAASEMTKAGFIS